ncbi:MAG: Stp1/IreP family PP2C-type Ser/Thr phosphatase [Actinomycetota bacterium]
MQLRGATASHVGNVRETNQDRAHFGGYVAVVADGMGGHQGGETAASIAISEVLDVIDPIATGGLVSLVEDANRAVFERAADPELRGMGTTLVALTLRPSDEKISVVNVGDSRAYFVRGGEMGQLTLDHSLVEDLVRQNRLTKEEALTHPQRNILTRALGIASEVEVDQFLVPTRIGDRFLLCSDGLFNEVEEDEILRILTDCPEPNEAADTLVTAALRGAGRDNITVAVVDVVPDGEAGNVSSSEPETLQMPAFDPPPEADGEVVLDASAAGGDFGGGGGLQHDSGAAGQTMTVAPAAAVGLVEPGPSLDHRATPGPKEVEPVVVPDLDRPRRRRLTPVLFTVGIVALLASAAYWGAGYWASQKWFIDVADGEQVVLVNGRPDGFWILGGDGGEPVGVTEPELSAEARLNIVEGMTFDSRQEALEYVEANRVDALDQTEAPAEDPTAPAGETGQGDAGGGGSNDVVEEGDLEDLSEGAEEGGQPADDATGN